MGYYDVRGTLAALRRSSRNSVRSLVYFSSRNASCRGSKFSIVIITETFVVENSFASVELCCDLVGLVVTIRKG